MTVTSGLRVAYLVSQYPALSHAFVETEVAALREAGVEVTTYTVRAVAAGQLLGDRMQSEAAATTVLLASPRVLALDQLRLLRRRPGAWLAGLRAALRAGRADPKSRLWQLFYLAEAVRLAGDMRRRGLRHVHVHLANNGADVARLAVVVGSAMTGEDWTWSLTMHGPAELADVEGSDLAAKVSSAAFTACISDFTRSQLMALVPVSSWQQLSVVHMTVDPARWQPGAAARADRAGQPLEVLFVGRLVEAKAPDVLLEALATASHARTRVTIVGTGPLAEHLAGRVVSLGLSDRVTLAGPVGQDRLPALYAAADVFCLPSFAEGLPVVLMEAMATELPVVTTAIAGIPELVRDGQTGLVVTAGRADQVAAALARLGEDAALRRRLGEAGRAAVLADFTPAHEVARLMELFAALPSTR